MDMIITIENDSMLPQNTVLLKFPQTRSDIIKVTPTTVGEILTFDRISSDTVRVILHDISIDLHQQHQVRVVYEGEPLGNPEYTFGDADTMFQITNAQRDSLRLSSLDGSAHVSAFEERMAALANVEDSPFLQASRFFAEYDHQTFPPLVSINPTISQPERQFRLFVIVKVADILRQRVVARGAQFTIDSSAPTASALAAIRYVSQDGTVNEPTNVDELSYLSTLQKAIIERNFHSPVQVEMVGEAFEHFTNGELRFVGGVRNAEPDSAYEFSFAEFAFAAIDFGVDAEFWARLLPGLVRTQRIFTGVYKPVTPDAPKYGDYRSSNFDEAKQVDDAFKEALRSEYRDLPMDVLALKAGEHAAHAFRGDFLSLL